MTKRIGLALVALFVVTGGVSATPVIQVLRVGPGAVNGPAGIVLTGPQEFRKPGGSHITLFRFEAGVIQLQHAPKAFDNITMKAARSGKILRDFAAWVGLSPNTEREIKVLDNRKRYVSVKNYTGNGVSCTLGIALFDTDYKDFLGQVSVNGFRYLVQFGDCSPGHSVDKIVRWLKTVEEVE